MHYYSNQYQDYPQHCLGHYRCQKSSGFDLPDLETLELLREKEVATKVLYYLNGLQMVLQLRGLLLPLFVARTMSSDVLALSYYEHESFQDLENASVTAQRDHSHCPHAPKSADARTLAHGLLAWGWVRWLVFGDFHVEWEWHGLKNRLYKKHIIIFNLISS